MNHLSKLPVWTVLVAALVVVIAAAPANASPWNVDAAHSSINFAVKHFFTPVNGKFNEFEIRLSYDPEDLATSSVEVTIPVASIDTGNERRDGHLRTADFFEVETYPTITFKSSSVQAGPDGSLIATGPLTIKGVSKDVDLAIQVLGVKEIPEEMQQMIGAKRVAGFSASTKVDRGDFGVGTGNYATDVVIGSDVEISIQVEANSD